MKYLDDNALLYFKTIIDDWLDNKVDKVPGYGLSQNDLTNALVTKINNAGSGSFTGDYGDLSNIPTLDSTQLKGALTKAGLGIASASDLADLLTRVAGLENLGQYVGAFNTYASVPQNKSGFSHITANDFITVRADETQGGKMTRYVATAINASTGAITWVYDITISTDITGKLDKDQGSSNSGKVLVVGSDGIVGLEVFEPLTNSEIDAIMGM
ncbi:MAG: hypothetical protein FWG40_00590 [Peptococcaceae bacterium]|nr:hypothetical protein [Peptococcaceae bacterium]